jgi:hypothetical protein
MVRRTCTSALPLGIALASLTVACSDQTATEPQAIADVDEYFESLPRWAEYSVPLSDEEVVATQPSFYEQSGNLFCSVTEASITRNPQEIVTYSPDSEIMWLGSLIQGRGHRDGLGSLLELPIRQRGPATIAIDILFSDNTRVVEWPTLASVGQAIGELIDEAQAAGHRAGSSIYFNQTESHSLEQSALKLGLSARYMGYSVRTSLETSRTASSSTLLATFTQKMFTTSMVLPQAPRDVFGPDFTEELLQEQVERGNIGPDNLPVYVGSITWGRLLTVTMTSSHSADEMKAALSASASFPGGSAGGSLSAEHKAVLDDSEIKVVAIGGHAQAAIDLIRTGKLSEYFKEDAPLTTARPISYVLRNLGDNTIAKVSETTEYAIRECEPGGVQRFTNYTAWRDSVQAQGLIERAFPTTEANVALATELTFPIGWNRNIGPRITFESANTVLPFDFYLENTNFAELATDYQKSWTLVFRDQELYGFEDRWISIGDVDGIGEGIRGVFENDDFDIRIIQDNLSGSSAAVHAIAITVGDNSAAAGESITVRGEGFDVRFEELGNGFIGFIAPFPIVNVHFDEDAGGDDIGIRDFYFGAN